VLRPASDPERPWLVCIHGYQMGTPMVDLSAFRPEWLHRELGLNLILPVLPLHGPRTIGGACGRRLPRRASCSTPCTRWRRRCGTSAGCSRGCARRARADRVYGLSLGGYSTALVSSLDDGLACVIAGIPATDFARLFFRHAPALQRLEAELNGIEERHMEEIHRVVSPLVLECRVPADQRYIFAAVADRLVPPDQVRDLWRHWDEPRIEWYQGAHLTFPRHPQVRQLLRDGLHASGLV
jgi:hypothetical protein